MDLSLDSKHFTDAAKNPLIVALLLVAGFIWLMMDRVVTREDAILEQGAEVQRELAVARTEMNAGFVALSDAMRDSNDRMELRAERWIAVLERQARLMAAQCYAAAETSEEQARCRNADTGN